jgi:hypothetical protein
MLPMLILRPQKFAFAFSLGQILLITSTWLVVPLQVQHPGYDGVYLLQRAELRN